MKKTITILKTIYYTVDDTSKSAVGTFITSTDKKIDYEDRILVYRKFFKRYNVSTILMFLEVESLQIGQIIE